MQDIRTEKEDSMRTTAQDRWDAENMTYQTVKVRRVLLDSFKAACAANGDKVNTVLREAMENYVSKKPKAARRYPRTEEQRNAYNAYQREYRRRNPDKTRRWRDDYTIRKAAKLQEEKEE